MNCSFSCNYTARLTTNVQDTSIYENYNKTSVSNIPIICLTFVTQNLRLKRTRYIPYKKENDFYILTCNIEGYVISVAEKTYSDMVNELQNEFFDAWQYYALEKDENLSNGAINVKKWLLENIQEV